MSTNSMMVDNTTIPVVPPKVDKTTEKATEFAQHVDAQIVAQASVGVDAQGAASSTRTLTAVEWSSPSDNPYQRKFELDKPSEKGGIVLQRVTWSELQPDGTYKSTTWYEAFVVKPGTDGAAPGDNFGVKTGLNVKIHAEATFYEGMTVSYLESKGFSFGSVAKAGNLYSKDASNDASPLTFSEYKSSNTISVDWNWPQ